MECLCEVCNKNIATNNIECVIALQTKFESDLKLNTYTNRVQYTYKDTIALNWCTECENLYIKKNDRKRVLPALIVWTMSILLVIVGLVLISDPFNLSQYFYPYDMELFYRLKVISMAVASLIACAGVLVRWGFRPDGGDFIISMFRKLGKFDGYSGCECFNKVHWDKREIMNTGITIH